MHKNIIITFFIIIISLNFANAQSLFNKRYDIEKGAEAFGKIIYDDNQYLIAGRSIDSMKYYIFPPPNAKIGLIGIDSIGNSLFQKRYGENIYNYYVQSSGIVKLNSNYYFNSTYADTSNKGHQFLLKFKKNGDSILLVHYHENDTTIQTYGTQCKITRDSNLILCGAVDSSYYGVNGKCYLMKTDTLGNIIWWKTYGGSNAEYCSTMDTCSDGGFILGGWTTSYGGSDKDPYIVKTDSDGNFEWHKTINSNSYNDWPAVVIGTKDGGVLAVTTEVQFQISITKWTKIFFNKYDINGNLMWRKSIGDTIYNVSAFSVKESESGDLYAMATTSYCNILYKLNANGDSLLMSTLYWIKGDCSVYDQYAFDMALTDNEGFAIAGFIAPTGPGGTPNNSQDAWLATFDSLGCQLPNKPYNLTAYISLTTTDTIVDLNWNYTSTSPNEVFVIEKHIKNDYVWDIQHDDCLNSGLYLGNIPIPNTNYTDTLSEEIKTKYRVFAIDTVTHLMSCHSNVVSIDLTNAVAETKQEEVMVKVYPNPAAESITVLYNIEDIGDGVFSIYSMDGKLILEKELNRADKQIRINTAALENGIYFYSLRSKGRFMGNGKIVLIK